MYFEISMLLLNFLLCRFNKLFSSMSNNQKILHRLFIMINVKLKVRREFSNCCSCEYYIDHSSHDKKSAEEKAAFKANNFILQQN